MCFRREKASQLILEDGCHGLGLLATAGHGQMVHRVVAKVGDPGDDAEALLLGGVKLFLCDAADEPAQALPVAEEAHGGRVVRVRRVVEVEVGRLDGQRLLQTASGVEVGVEELLRRRNAAVRLDCRQPRDGAPWQDEQLGEQRVAGEHLLGPEYRGDGAVEVAVVGLALDLDELREQKRCPAQPRRLADVLVRSSSVPPHRLRDPLPRNLLHVLGDEERRERLDKGLVVEEGQVVLGAGGAQPADDAEGRGRRRRRPRVELARVHLLLLGHHAARRGVERHEAARDGVVKVVHGVAAGHGHGRGDRGGGRGRVIVVREERVGEDGPEMSVGGRVTDDAVVGGSGGRGRGGGGGELLLGCMFVVFRECCLAVLLLELQTE